MTVTVSHTYAVDCDSCGRVREEVSRHDAGLLADRHRLSHSWAIEHARARARAAAT